MERFFFSDEDGANKAVDAMLASRREGATEEELAKIAEMEAPFRGQLVFHMLDIRNYVPDAEFCLGGNREFMALAVRSENPDLRNVAAVRVAHYNLMRFGLLVLVEKDGMPIRG